MGMKCPSCGRENVEGSSFCSVCANPILISRIWSSNPHDHSGFSNPAGTSREFTCQIATPITGATAGMNAQVLSRGIEEGQPMEPTVEQPSPFDPPEGTTP